ncbi:NAD(P)/FAD-dependent oxidoreductase [uncultured Mitsuokella sp.]|uniref:NAD(P)/FAD-dependent oxidoreductase n=1 Tax=uncultured Mitsuokella sp. TaxID=453120 RepID=UPI0025E121FB|nr:NAD(P)/FAD-dependent oxidoreductase [uncultured Mitsuokella sp.]
MKQIIVVGAGPAGMMAAIRAAENGANVTLLEKMKKPGRKMMITGKGRCNITNAADVPEIIRNIHGNGAFLNSSMRTFDNQDVMEFFRQQGVPVKVERGNRVFPVSDKAQDAVDAMVHRLHELGVKIELEMPVADILTQDGRVAGVRTKSGAHYKADAVILAVGGASYPGTGSTGDGYEMAKKLGHTIVPLRPSLVPLETEEEWVKDLQGLSLRNVRVTLLANNEKVQEMFGEMMFTHFGVTGPIILSLSRKAAECLAAGKYVELEINLKPALTPEKLDARIQRDFDKYIRKSLKNGLVDLLPHKMIEPLLDYAFLDPDRPVNQVTAAERHRLVEVLQHLILIVTKTRPLSEAIVTAGGVSVREINPKTMESKLVPGLYFAGEVTDVDAYTGGYNLQAAFSMGNAAGCWSVWNDD